MQAIAAGLVKRARAGDVAAAKVLLRWTVGPPVQADLFERLDEIERLLEGEHR